eukprot:761852-Hanusia_phi.AAC.7
MLVTFEGITENLLKAFGDYPPLSGKFFLAITDLPSLPSPQLAAPSACTAVALCDLASGHLHEVAIKGKRPSSTNNALSGCQTACCLPDFSVPAVLSEYHCKQGQNQY